VITRIVYKDGRKEVGRGLLPSFSYDESGVTLLLLNSKCEVKDTVEASTVKRLEWSNH
jgi:hypothetical protein